MTLMTTWQDLNYDISPIPMRFRTLLVYTEQLAWSDEEKEAIHAITKALPPFSRLITHEYNTLNLDVPYTEPLVGMRITMDGFLSTNLVTVPYSEFDIKRVPWNHVL